MHPPKKLEICLSLISICGSMLTAALMCLLKSIMFLQTFGSTSTTLLQGPDFDHAPEKEEWHLQQ